MTDTGRTTRPMGSEFTVIWTEHATKAIGKKTSSMVKAWRLGQMVQAIKETMLKDAKTVKAASLGRIKAHTTETSSKTTLRAMVSATLKQIFWWLQGMEFKY